ncbi:MAG: hypothetical protein P8X89_01495 [Reinekea sp.]
MLPKNWGEPMGAPAIFEKQIEIKLLHPASTMESRIQVIVTCYGCYVNPVAPVTTIVIESKTSAVLTPL